MKLFGRDAEAAALRAFLDERMDHRRLMLLRGDPGSGKSALLEFAVSIAPPGLVLTMAGLDVLRNVELAASMTALGRLADVARDESLLTRVLAEEAGAGVMPVQLFEAARRILQDKQASLFIDDLQWLDRLSQSLVIYLLKNSQQPSRVIAASRHGVVAGAFFEEARKAGADPLTVDIGGLDEVHGVRLVKAMRPAIPDDAARSIWERSGGVPYWLIALSTDRESGSPDEVLTSRLSGARFELVTLLIHLAVLGRAVTLDGVGMIFDWDKSHVEEAVTDLEARGLVRRQLDRVSLIHDLVREEALAQASEDSQRDAHLRISRYLETMQDDPTTEIQIEALHHRIQGGAPARSMALAILGSSRRPLLGQGGLATLALAADQLGPEDEQASALRRGVAELAAEIGAAETASHRWRIVYERSRDLVERTWAACQVSRIALLSDDFGEARKWLEAARAIADVDELNRIELATLEGGLLMQAERRQHDGFAIVEEAMKRAGQLVLIDREDPKQDPLRRSRTVRADVLQAAYDSAMIAANQLKSLEVASMMVEAARSDFERMVAVGQQGRALMRVGRPLDALSVLTSLWESAQEMALVIIIARFGPAYAASLYETGHLPDAVRVAEEVVPIAERNGFPRAAYFARGILVTSSLVTGDWRAGLDSMRAEVDREVDPHFRLTLRERVAVYLSRTMGTRSAHDINAILEEGWSDAGQARCGRCASEFAVAAAEASARVRLTKEARTWLERFHAIGVPYYPLLDAYVRIADVLIAGDPDPIDLTRQSFETMGYQVEQLWFGLDLAASRSDRPGRAGAAETYREVGASAERLGAVTIQHLAEKALRDMGARTWRRTTPGEILGFTRRELEIALMAAAGSSNREIAESLFLSKKTVERHLSNILAKAGVRNRVELAGLLSNRLAPNEGVPR